MKKIKINELNYDFSKYGSLRIITPVGSAGSVFIEQFFSQLVLIKNAKIMTTDEVFIDRLISYDLINVKHYDIYKEKNEIYYYIKYLYQLCHQRIIGLKLKCNHNNVKKYNEDHKIKMNPEFLIINFETLTQDEEIQKMCQFIIDYSKLTNIYIIDLESQESSCQLLNMDSEIVLNNRDHGSGSLKNNQYFIEKLFEFNYVDKYQIKSQITQKNNKTINY